MNSQHVNVSDLILFSHIHRQSIIIVYKRIDYKAEILIDMTYNLELYAP